MDAIRDRCKVAWNLGKTITINEMMIKYKGTYCPICQYMPNKLEKWGLKVWCLPCSTSKYVWNFEVYYGKECLPAEVPLDPNGIPPLLPPPASCGEAKLAHNLVVQLLQGLWYRGHVVVMDNYFSNICLILDLLERGMYAIGTVRANRIGLPEDLRNTKSFKNVPQDTTIWEMHDDRHICCVMWKDKKPVFLISTHEVSIQAPIFAHVVVVPQSRGAVWELIQTTSVLLEYTTFMQGMDVVDQLRASYTSQVRSHKWWHQIFFFLLNMTVVNMYIIYLDCFEEFTAVG